MRVLHSVRPQGVVIELCRERTAILRDDVMRILARGRRPARGMQHWQFKNSAALHAEQPRLRAFFRACQPKHLLQSLLSLAVRRMLPDTTVPGMEIYVANKVCHWHLTSRMRVVTAVG